jgi:Calpain family cysteine protease/Calpain large subunit, domain III
MLGPEIKELAEGIFLHKSPISKDSYEFYLEVNRLNSIEILSDFTLSENIYIEGTSKLTVSTTVHPFSKTKIALIKLMNNWAIRSKFVCKVIDPPKAVVLDAMKKEVKEMKIRLDNIKGILARVFIDLTPLNEIEKILQTNGVNFIDSDFPPIDFLENIKFVWKRLSHAYPKSLLLPKRIEPFDIKIGESKDNWIKNALALLAERPACLERLFITKQTNPYGIYRVKLCKNNEWNIVTVDDYIPCLPSGGFLLCSTIDNTYWAPILEKSYCKLFNSYNVLSFPGFSEIISDFTGCPCEIYTLNSFSVQSLWETLYVSIQKEYICGLYNENDEVPEIYSILKLHFIEEKGLVLCRNLTERVWKGKWSSKSKLWTGKIKEKLSPAFENTSFWVEVDEISENFNRLIISKISNWYEFRHKGEFVKTSDKTLSNVYFSINITEKTHTIISLHQEDERDTGVNHGRPYIDLGMIVFKIDDENLLTVTGKKDLCIDRNCSLNIDLDPGEYIILPITSGCLLRSPSEISPEKMKLLDPKGGMSPLLESTLNDIFNKNQQEKTLKFDNFKKIFEASGKTLTEIEFKQKVLKKFINKDDGITLPGFKNYFIDQIKSLPEDFIWNWLENLGYDRDFYSVRSRLYFLSVHSESQFEVITRKNVFCIEEQAYVYLIQNYGTEIESKGGVKVFYYLFQDVHCYLYGVFNSQDQAIEATLDCSESENMVFNQDDPSVTKVVGSSNLCYMITAIALPHAETFVRSARCVW